MLRYIASFLLTVASAVAVILGGTYVVTSTTSIALQFVVIAITALLGAFTALCVVHALADWAFAGSRSKSTAYVPTTTRALSSDGGIHDDGERWDL